jgi:hypothetical protein
VISLPTRVLKLLDNDYASRAAAIAQWKHASFTVRGIRRSVALKGRVCSFQ